MMKCRVCEHEQESGTECDTCGLAFPKSALPPVPGPAPWPAPASPGQPLVLGCPSCGQPTAEAFCPACGVRVRPASLVVPQAAPARAPEPPRAYACPYCRQPTTEVFCATCGIRVRPKRSEEQLAADASSVEGEVSCKACGKVTSAIMCPECGTRIIRSAL